MNKITVETVNTQYSRIKVERPNGEIKEHLVSNNGWYPLEYWIEYFKKEQIQ